MKIFSRVLVTVFVVSLVLGLAGPAPVSAATTPSLGAAAPFGILANNFTRNIAVTSIIGNLGYTTLAGSGSHTVTGTTHVADGTYNQAGIDQGTALTALAAQPCTFTFAPGAINLATDTTHGPVGVYTPGVYCTSGAGAASIGTGGITLRGSGTYIFRVNGALTSVANSNVTLADGASSCDVFWTPTAATTLGANTTFKGTVIDDSGITVGNTTAWIGRALAFGGTVTTDTDTITSTCTIAAGEAVSSAGTINVVKTVINDSGGTKTAADFQLFVSGTTVNSGVTYSFRTGEVYFITETPDPTYTRTFSGDCDINGRLQLNGGENKFCIVTNNDIGAPAVPPVPPLIEVIKVPSPLALPAGPGPVTYTYTLRNIGTVPVTNITMVGDTCSPIVLVSGDVNADAKLDVNETWVHRCSTTLSSTHTNTVVATGWANGLSAIDIASATVVVGLPIVPPLIHVTKIPSPLTLRAGGGMVTYTKKVTNPGTVALNNVRITDDKCGPVNYISGDANGDSKLDTTETWTYTCRTNLTSTTTNTVTASGDANGLTARDFAIATVVVAAPGLPRAGSSPQGKSIPWNIVVLAGLLMLSSASLAVVLKKRTS